jgi:hypothetical protein
MLIELLLKLSWVRRVSSLRRTVFCRGNIALGCQNTERGRPTFFRPAPKDLLRMWPVSKRVNESGRGDDDPSLIEPAEDEAIARWLDVRASTNEPYHARHHGNCYSCPERKNGAALDPPPPFCKPAQSKDGRNKIKQQRHQKQRTQALIKIRHQIR